VLTLAEHLPEDSALHAAVRGGPEFRPWTTSAFMLAATVNLLNAANHQRAGKRGRALIKPPQKRVRHKRVAKVGQVGARAAAALNRMRG